MMKKRDDEELCKSVFNTYLLKLFVPEEIIWTPVEQRYEPPDFYLELAEEKFAVEVTSLVEKSRMGGGGELSYLSTLFPLKQLVDRVSVHARRDGYLHGGYLVVFKEPFENFEKIKSKLEMGLLDYIRNTKEVVSAPELLVYRKVDQICTVTKVHNRASEVRMIWNRGGINVDGMETDICRLAKEAVQEKEYRLRNISLPKIILLYDRYGFGEYNLGNLLIREHCAEALADQLCSFRSVFVVRDDNQGFIFYPKEALWGRALFSTKPA